MTQETLQHMLKKASHKAIALTGISRTCRYERF